MLPPVAPAATPFAMMTRTGAGPAGMMGMMGAVMTTVSPNFVTVTERTCYNCHQQGHLAKDVCACPRLFSCCVCVCVVE